jgi:hypothetical protein
MSQQPNRIMTICPKCFDHYQVDQALAGTEVPCRRCEAKVLVPRFPGSVVPPIAPKPEAGPIYDDRGVDLSKSGDPEYIAMHRANPPSDPNRPVPPPSTAPPAIAPARDYSPDVQKPAWRRNLVIILIATLVVGTFFEAWVNWANVRQTQPTGTADMLRSWFSSLVRIVVFAAPMAFAGIWCVSKMMHFPLVEGAWFKALAIFGVAGAAFGLSGLFTWMRLPTAVALLAMLMLLVGSIVAAILVVRELFQLNVQQAIVSTVVSAITSLVGMSIAWVIVVPNEKLYVTTFSTTNPTTPVEPAPQPAQPVREFRPPKIEQPKWDMPKMPDRP